MKIHLRQIIQNATGAPVDWGAIPQGTIGPRVRITQISGADIYTMRGPVANTSRIQVDCFAETYKESSEVSESVKAALSGYSSHSDGIGGVFLDSVRDLSDTESGEILHRISLDFTVNTR